MRAADILRLAVVALFQQKARTTLTACGVAVGALVLLLSLSIGTGLQEAVARELRRHDELRKIEVRAGYGKVEEHIPPEEIVVKGNVPSPDAASALLTTLNTHSPRNVSAHK